MKRLVVVALLAGLVAVPGLGHADDKPRSRASWSGLNVPYVAVKDVREYQRPIKLRFQHRKIDYWSNFRDGILSMTATADAAIVMPNDYCYGSCDIHNGHAQFFEGPLLEVAGDGTTGVVERKSFGIPLADPVGHHAFWTKREKRRMRVMAYDTRTHTKIRGPVVRRSQVFAVEGETAYLVGGLTGGAVGAASWTPGSAEVVPVPLPPSNDPDDGRLLLDVSRGRVLSVDLAGEDGPTLLSDMAGNVLREVPVVFATFSPDGRYLADFREPRVKVLDVDTNTLLVPSLGKKWRSTDFRWAPDGRLVLNAVRRDVYEDYDDADPVIRFVCTFPDAGCSRLPGRSALFLEQVLPTYAFGQFLAGLLPYISRTGSPRELVRRAKR